jgi:hypothetical protein
MGAATCMMYLHSDDRIMAACFDSPFCDFNKLSKELCRKQIKIPNFILDIVLSFLTKTIKKKHKFDISDLKPITYAPKTTTPGFFLHAMNDELVPLEHTLSLFEVYGGENKSLNVCEGTHNSVRLKHIMNKIGDFFVQNLKGEHIIDN